MQRTPWAYTATGSVHGTEGSDEWDVAKLQGFRVRVASRDRPIATR
jgi:hypothetical protein